jgi:hypothetical protein
MAMKTFPWRAQGMGLWLAAFGALGAVIGWETVWGQRVAPQAQSAAPQPVTVSLLPEYTIEGSAASRRETIERPAFVPTRRPAPLPATQEAPKPKMARGQFTLTGTAVVDQKQIAFLRETAGGKARTVRTGETINGLTVAEIKIDRVKLVQGDESEDLLLKVAAGPRTTIQPPQPGVPPAGQPGQPVKPVPGAPPAAAAAQPHMDSDQTILERRRAARAAQAAQEQAIRDGQQRPATPVVPNPQPFTPPPGSPEAAARAGANPNTNPDPRWGDVYRRMQQRGAETRSN